MVGCGMLCRARFTEVQRASVSACAAAPRSAMKSAKSWPELKTGPSASRITTRTRSRSSPSARRSRASSEARTPCFSGFRFRAFASVTVMTKRSSMRQRTAPSASSPAARARGGSHSSSKPRTLRTQGPECSSSRPSSCASARTSGDSAPGCSQTRRAPSAWASRSTPSVASGAVTTEMPYSAAGPGSSCREPTHRRPSISASLRLTGTTALPCWW
mmetsp:Transcript_109651/g.354001  ORF Transcript_109651/g.354001 Transcript_109651/m.354001 type:complete len:216 (-) Transcript_109651:106-753(-)